MAEGKKTSYTFVLDKQQQDDLVGILSTGNYKPVTVPYTKIAVKALSWDCNVNLYTSGKCLIQGSGAEEFIINVMEPSVLKRIVVGYEEVVSPEQLEPHMGVDESGKGDFFGPLVVASAYTNKDLYYRLKEIGVKDSKAITSDKQALVIASKIRNILGPERFSVIRIGNGAYNKLYNKLSSVNRVLGWGHARCIENLLGLVTSCPKAISDQFGSEETVKRALLAKGRNIELVQRHKAESDIAVAAASILAREGFLLSLKQMEEKYGIVFPKGASEHVRDVACEFISKHGVEELANVAKCHFKTTDVILQESGHTREELPEYARVQSKDYSSVNFHKKKE